MSRPAICLVVTLFLAADKFFAQTIDSFNPGANDTVNTIVVQPDGKLLVGGFFSALGGQPRNLLGRLNADGSLDAAFNGDTNIVGYEVECISVEADGSILVGGDLIDRLGRPGLIRLFTDGTLDTNFDAGIGGKVVSVSTVSADDQGRILVGGYFQQLGHEPHEGFGRLSTSGKADSSFHPVADVAAVYTTAPATSEEIWIGGPFMSLNDSPIVALGLLFENGSLNEAFNANLSGTAYSIAVEADNKLLVGGLFTDAGHHVEGLIRFNSDGSLDAQFAPHANAMVTSLAHQADGRIIVVGEFNSIGGTSSSGLVRLNPDGTIDPSMNPVLSTNSFLSCVAVQADGAILVGGWFSSIAGVPRRNIARITNPGTIVDGLATCGSRILWHRGGVVPEVRRTTFELATNETGWMYVGAGGRIATDWLCSAGPIATNSLVRVRGFIQYGFSNGSDTFIERVMPVNPLSPPVLAIDPSLKGELMLRVDALLGQVVAIDRSFDLLNWSPLSTNLTVRTPFTVICTNGQTTSRKFFRARVLPSAGL